MKETTLSLSLMIERAKPRDVACPSAPTGPTCDEVALDHRAVVDAAALLNGVVLTNGEAVTSYDFSGTREDGVEHLEAHVMGFGPGLLPIDVLESLRILLKPHDGAEEALDDAIGRGIQMSMSTQDGGMREKPHMRIVDADADTVEFQATASSMHRMLRTLGVESITRDVEDEFGEVDFATFERAVQTNGHLTGSLHAKLERFVACARRNDAVTVYWA